MIEHRGLLNMVLNHLQYLDLQPGYRVLQFASLSFDGSCQEIFNTLCSGGSLVLVSRAQIASAEQIGELIAGGRIDIATLPPSYQSVIKEQLVGLKILYSAGEPLHVETGRYIESKGVRLINGYGPTENSVTISITDKAICADGSVTVGKPLGNVQVYILDEAGNLAPVGVAGELCVAGEQVARGYLNQAELTAQKFIPNPFNGAGGSLLYRTGDLARWQEDGNIELIGRKDNQVKIRGYRVELGEIEQVLQQAPGVRQAITQVIEEKQGHKRLLAFITGHDHIDKTDVTAFLQSRLPEYMVPSLLVQVDSMPITPNGKVDMRRLQEMYVTTAANKDGYVAPVNKTQEDLVAIWQELLGVEPVGIHDNFFELGGDSIITIQVVSRAETPRLRISGSRYVYIPDY